MGPLLTINEHKQLLAAAQAGAASVVCSLDLGRSTSSVAIRASTWVWQDQEFPYLDSCKDRSIYYWDGECFQVVSRFTHSLIKLVPTTWGPPTFEIDGIKMLPTAHISPYADAK